MVPRKIAFITMVPKSASGAAYSSQSVANRLKNEFPDLEFHHIDVMALLKNRKDLLVLNLFHVIREYWFDILLQKKRVRRCFLVTSNMFKQINQLLSNVVSPDEYLFTFQMQSLFDASQPGLPHFVYTDHTVLANIYYPGFDRREVLYSKPWMALEKSIYQNTEVIFTRSSNITRSLQEQYDVPATKIVCVYAGSNIIVKDTKVNASDYQNKHILFVGKDWQRKRGPDLAEAFKLVLRKHPDAWLTIVGSLPEINLPNCEVVGEVPLRDMNQYYERASIFCLPTNFEPFGIVFIEALAHRLPVVATNIGAIPDFVIHGENGYLVQPGNVSKLAQVLIDLLDDPEKCRTFGQRGYELMQARYTWDKVGARIKETILVRLGLPTSPSST